MNQTVTIQPGELEIEVQDGETILEAGLRRGLNLPYSCRSGSCMACLATLTRGEVLYRQGPPMGLSESDRDQGKVLMCQAEAVSELEIETLLISSADLAPLRRLPCRVEHLQKLAPDVMAMHLKLPPVGPFEFRAGQYIDFLLSDGDHRSFSMANPPHAADMLEVHVRHVPDGRFSDHVFGELKEKDLLRLIGPLGNFYVRDDVERPLLMIAGGTGYAPIQSMLQDLIHRQDSRPVVFYWGARACRDLYLDAAARALAMEHPQLSYVPVLSDPDAADGWQGRTGLVHRAVLDDYPDLSAFDIYLSGPPPMIEAARDDFATGGAREERLFFDAFDFSPRVQAVLEAT